MISRDGFEYFHLLLNRSVSGFDLWGLTVWWVCRISVLGRVGIFCFAMGIGYFVSILCLFYGLGYLVS